jgi:hypothetical protein
MHLVNIRNVSFVILSGAKDLLSRAPAKKQALRFAQDDNADYASGPELFFSPGLQSWDGKPDFGLRSASAAIR